MSYLATSGYEFFGDIEIRIFQETSDPISEGLEQQRSIFSTDPQQKLTATYGASFRLPDGETYTCSLPPLPDEELLEQTDPRLYGEALFNWLFDDKMKHLYFRFRRSAEFFSSDEKANFNGLRMRLWLDPYSVKLHSLWWEAMYDPEAALPLSNTMAFSRFMRVRAPEGPITDGPLKFLLIASNPEGLRHFDLANINVSLEKSIISHAIESLRDKLKVERWMSDITLENLSERLREGHYHIIHMLAHSVFHDDQGFMILADDKGDSHEVPIQTVASALTSAKEEPPHLVFLAVPLTLEEYVGQTLVSMAPMIVDAGAQAAVAAQGSISEEKLSRFCNCFYETLIKTGVIDLAMMAARAEIYDPNGWEWAFPVLYMRTPDGQLFRPLPESLRSMTDAVAAL